MNILAIETSCDETACAVVEASGGTRPSFRTRASVISSQVAVHSPFGGVVPTLAAREHVNNLPVVYAQTLRAAKLKEKDIDLVAVTQGPGLVIALLVGIQFARGLAYKLKKKLVPVNHIAGHIYSNWLLGRPIGFSLLNVVVSGGHTELILMERSGKFTKLGETRDDAAGEAFDKVANMLKLGYPGGPAISKLAARGNAERFSLPRPMIGTKDFDFSFSGLKTAVLYLLRAHPNIMRNKQARADLAASFEQAVVDTLVAKTLRAAKKTKAKTVALSGGVSANTRLRAQLETALRTELPKTAFLVPDPALSTDNAVMIAVSAYLQKHKAASWKKLDAKPNLSVA